MGHCTSSAPWYLRIFFHRLFESTGGRPDMTTVRIASGSREGVGTWRLGRGVTFFASLDGEEAEALFPLSARLG